MEWAAVKRERREHEKKEREAKLRAKINEVRVRITEWAAVKRERREHEKKE